MTKIPITPVSLPLNLGIADSMEIEINHKIGNPEVALTVYLYDGNRLITITPYILNASEAVQSSWSLNLSPITDWVMSELGATKL